jgi:hypothetical protein
MGGNSPLEMMQSSENSFCISFVILAEFESLFTKFYSCEKLNNYGLIRFRIRSFFKQKCASLIFVGSGLYEVFQ